MTGPRGVVVPRRTGRRWRGRVRPARPGPVVPVPPGPLPAPVLAAPGRVPGRPPDRTRRRGGPRGRGPRRPRMLRPRCPWARRAAVVPPGLNRPAGDPVPGAVPGVLPAWPRGAGAGLSTTVTGAPSRGSAVTGPPVGCGVALVTAADPDDGDHVVEGVLKRRGQYADDRGRGDAANGEGDDRSGRSDLARQRGEPERATPPRLTRRPQPGAVVSGAADPELGQCRGLVGQLVAAGAGAQRGQDVGGRAQVGRDVLGWQRSGEQRGQGLVREGGLVPAG